MSTFKIGQRVVCIDDNQWFNNDTFELDDIGPRNGDICKVVGFDPDGYLYLEEWPQNDDSYHSSSFRPLDSLTAQFERIELELTQQLQPA